jgi:hypothetical protein
MDKYDAEDIIDVIKAKLNSIPGLENYNVSVGRGTYTADSLTLKVIFVDKGSKTAETGVNPEWANAYNRKCFIWNMKKEQLNTEVSVIMAGTAKKAIIVGAMKGVRDKNRAPIIVKMKDDNKLIRVNPSMIINPDLIGLGTVKE